MMHGIATIKKEINENLIIGMEGIITAYLPDDERFAVHFGGTNWVTFQWTEEQFLEYFELQLNEPRENYRIKANDSN